MLQRLLMSVVVSLTIAAQFATPSMAQDFPKKGPIKIIVPVPAGGGTDIQARITAEFLSKRLGQTVIVDNRPGASSTIGANLVAKAPPDGYTILFTGVEFGVVPAVKKEMPYTLNDFTYLVRSINIPPVLIASEKYKPSTIQELLADIKARPGEVKAGNTGTGAIVHVVMSMFENAAGLKLLHVPYQGIAPVFTALRSGDIDISASTTPIADGFKILASLGTKRNPLYPNLPTMQELGIKAAWEGWFGFLAPANLPKPIADRLTTEIVAVLKDPAMIAKYNEAMKHPPEAQPMTGDTFKQHVLEENKNWKVVADRANIVLD